MARRIAIVSLVVLGLLVPGIARAQKGGKDPACWASARSVAVEQGVTFSASGLSTGGATYVEVISGTNGYRESWGIGNVDSYSFSRSFDDPGVYGAVFSKDTGGKTFRMKCDVYVTVTGT